MDILKIWCLAVAVYFGVIIVMRMAAKKELYTIQAMLFTIGLVGFLVLQFNLI